MALNPQVKIKGPDNPTSQLLPRIRTQSCSVTRRQDRQGRLWMIDEWKRCMWRGCVWKMVCDNGACGRWCVTTLCMKDGVWQRCVWKMVCNQDVCVCVWQGWCVTKLCVKDGVWQSCVCVWQSCVCVCVTKMCVKDGVWQSCVWQRWCLTKPSPISATFATQNEGWCHQVPRLPRETKVDVTKCPACHAKVPRGQSRPRSPKRVTRPAQPHKCHACHAKPRLMSPSATAATWNEGGCHQVPRLPRKSAARSIATKGPKRITRPSPVPQVPRLPRKTKVDVTKCHVCHVKRRGPKRVTKTQPSRSRGINCAFGSPCNRYGQFLIRPHGGVWHFQGHTRQKIPQPRLNKWGSPQPSKRQCTPSCYQCCSCLAGHSCSGRYKARALP